ncbi:hypothetical protein [Pseudomonas oryzihabitans]|uniref:Uncharacterized protein n=2 Tax=Pseudomonas TaxID=286 RepID=A0A178LMG6_9PSED|nr:hypothetical protein [Pseudomonas oryzihabitans]OAN31716.1 hypothetical protein A4V15_11690 [Pseudomonas oryzihabitans]
MLPDFKNEPAEQDLERVLQQLQTLDRREALGVGAIHAYLSARPFFAGRQGLLAWGLVLMSLSVVVSVAGGWRWWMAILPSVVLAFQIGAYVWLHREATEGYRLVRDKISPRYLAAAVRNRALLDRVFREQLYKGGRGAVED